MYKTNIFLFHIAKDDNIFHLELNFAFCNAK